MQKGGERLLTEKYRQQKNILNPYNVGETREVAWRLAYSVFEGVQNASIFIRLICLCAYKKYNTA